MGSNNIKAESLVNSEEILQFLGKIIDSEQFSRQKSLKKLLRYVTEKTLQGEQDTIKAYTIAVDVFDRPTSFDAATDTIVRVQAGKLRRTLEWYYRSIGSDDAVRIHIPKGTYVPQFISQTEFFENRAEPTDGTREHARLPRIGIMPFSNETGDLEQDVFSTGVAEQLSDELSRFNGVQVVSYRSVYKYIEQTEEGDEHVICRFDLDYLLTGSVYHHNNVTRTAVNLIDCSSNNQVWSDRFEDERAVKTYFQIQDAIVDKIIPLIGDTFGVIPRNHFKPYIEKSHANVNLVEGYFYFYYYNLNLTPENHSRAYRLLGGLKTTHGQDPTLLAMLGVLEIDAVVLFFGSYEQHVPAALELAYKALQLDPSNQQVHFTMCSAMLLQGSLDEVRYHASQIVDINPKAAYMKGVAGWFIALTGDYDTGLGLIEESKNLNPMYPSWFHLPYLLKCFQQKDYGSALKEAHLFSMADFYWGPMLRAITYSYLDKRDHAQLEYRKAIELNPDLVDTPRKYISYFVTQPELVDQMVDCLSRLAGEIGG
jgi:adenylate cyclase